MIASAATSLGLLVLIYLPLELLFPVHDQRPWRRSSLLDLTFFLGLFLLWNAPVVAALTWFVHVADTLPLTEVRGVVGAWPLWTQAILAVLLCDVCVYWAHRWSHRSALLWRFHRVHHSAERLDFLAAYREHPLDNLFTRTVENVPAILLGIPLHVIAGFVVFRGLWAIYIHSNIRLEPGPLRTLLGSPRLHHWHHEHTRHGSVNFANLSPLMDRFFGTYFDPGQYPERYGVHQRTPRGYLGQLVEPFVPKRLQRRGRPTR